MKPNLILLKGMVWVFKLVHLKNIEITSFMVHLMAYQEYKIVHGKLDGLLVVMSLVQEDETVLRYSVGI